MEGKNPTNSSAEENDSVWEIKGLVPVKRSSIQRALKHLQEPPGAVPHLQGRLLHQPPHKGEFHWILGRSLMEKASKWKLEQDLFKQELRKEEEDFRNGSSFFFRKNWEGCPSPSAEVFRDFLEMTL